MKDKKWKKEKCLNQNLAKVHGCLKNNGFFQPIDNLNYYIYLCFIIMKNKEQRFLDLVGDPIKKTDREKYPDITFFYTKDDKYLAEYDEKDRNLWINYDIIWSVFEKEYNMKDIDIRSFIKSMVEKHFKLKDVTPMDIGGDTAKWGWKNISNR